jgi:Spy/CpxP family protein refolding chaperone
MGAQLTRETAELGQVLDATPIDEAAAGREAADVVRLEAALKQTHLGLLVRIRNVLTEPQRQALDRLRRP